MKQYDFTLEEKMQYRITSEDTNRMIRQTPDKAEKFFTDRAVYVMQGLDDVSAKELVIGNSRTADLFAYKQGLDNHEAADTAEYLDHLITPGIRQFLDDAEFAPEDKFEAIRISQDTDDPRADITDTMCRLFDLRKPFESDEKVQKLVKVVYEKIYDELSGFYDDFDETEHARFLVDPEGEITDFIMEGGFRTITMSGDKKDIDGHRFLFGYNNQLCSNHLLSNVNMLLYRNNIILNIDDGWSKRDRARVEEIVRTAVRDYIFDEILIMLHDAGYSDYEAKIQEFENSRLAVHNGFGLKDFKQSIRQPLNPYIIKKVIRGKHESYFTSGIYMAACMALIKESVGEERRRSLKEKMSGSTGKQVFIDTKTVKKLSEENADLNKQIEKLKETNEELRNRPISPEQEAEIERMKREIAYYREQIAGLNKTIRQKDEELESYREKDDRDDIVRSDPAMTTEKFRQDDIPEEIYTNKYLFLCQHETTTKRLLDRFPNSVSCNGKYELDPRTAKTITAVVCITKEISHPEQDRIKGRCSMFNMPFLNSNSVNVERVARDIYEQLGGPEKRIG